MTWVSLVCLLILSSSALGVPASFRGRLLATDQSGYGSVQTALPGGVSSLDKVPLSQQRPFLNSLGFGGQVPTTGLSNWPPTGSGVIQQQDLTSGYGSSSIRLPQQQDIQPAVLPVSQPIVPTSSFGSLFGSQVPKSLSSMSLQDILPATTGYGGSSALGSSQRVLPQLDIKSGYSGYGSQQPMLDTRPGYGPQQPVLDQQPPVPSQADVLCQGQPADTVIPLQDTRVFVVCVGESKGFEQHCPKGLQYHRDARRCERKLGPLENPCASQPCLNGGQCVPTDVTSYQCQCPPGFDGKTCELDARVCQQQQPCGPTTAETRCQSFRLGAALQYVCICQTDKSYGPNCQQAIPSPCTGVDGPQPLSHTDKGFIMCDGERMFVESCPGGTLWDDLNKACVWPDMQGVVGGVPPQQDQLSGYGMPTARVPQSDQRVATPGYGQRIPQMDQRTMIPSFDQRSMVPSLDQRSMVPSFDQRSMVPSINQRVPSFTQTLQQDQMRIPSFNQGVQQDQSRVPSFNPFAQQDQMNVPSFGQRQTPMFDQTGINKVPSSFGGSSMIPRLDQTSSFGSLQPMQQDLTQPRQSSPY
jgi:hypothetical protein